MDDFTRAKDLLTGGEFTAVLCKSDCTFTSKARGVKPLVLWVEDSDDYSGYVAADKVVGKATAFLYLILAVTKLYAGIISKPALEILQENGVLVEYGSLVDHIINRQGDGICPFEETVLKLTDKSDAYLAIREKMRQMNISL